MYGYYANNYKSLINKGSDYLYKRNRALKIREAQIAKENAEEKMREVQKQKEERSRKLQFLLELFFNFFAESPSVIEAVAPLFESWRKIEFNKYVANAMIQLENVLKQSGYQEEWLRWERYVRNEFR